MIRFGYPTAYRYGTPGHRRVQGPSFSPSDISGLIIWNKADSLALTNGAAVSSWTDSSSNANHATQATAANKPTFITNQINGKPIVRFDGTDFLTTTVLIASTAAVSVYIVVKNSSTSPGNYLLSMGTDLNAIISEFVAGKWEYYSSPRTVIGNTSTTVFQIIKTTVGSSVLGGWVVGAWSSGSSPFIGDVAEIIVYNSVLSGANDTSVTSYLQSKYGL